MTMKKQLLMLSLTMGLTALPIAASAAQSPTALPIAASVAQSTGLQSHTAAAVSPAVSTYLGKFYYSPAIGQQSPTSLSFTAGSTSTLLQLNVTQSTLALNTPITQLLLYSHGIQVGSQTVYGSGTGTFSFSVTPGQSYYVDVKNTGTCSVNGSFDAYLN